MNRIKIKNKVQTLIIAYAFMEENDLNCGKCGNYHKSVIMKYYFVLTSCWFTTLRTDSNQKLNHKYVISEKI